MADNELIDWTFVAYSMVAGLAFGLIAYGAVWSFVKIIDRMAD